MRSGMLRSSAAGAAIAWACLGPCRANPIGADDAAAQVDMDPTAAGPAATLPPPGASMPLAGVSRGAAGERLSPSSTDTDNKTQAQEQADAMASARDPSLLPIDMQGVGGRAHPAPSALPKGQASEAPPDDGAFKKLALSARDWMQDLFGRPDNAQDGPSGDASRGAPSGAGELGLPVETQSGGVRAMAPRAERQAQLPAPGAASRHAAAAPPAQPTAGARLLADSAPEYVIQHVVQRFREVLVHPLTWLAIVLVGVTHIVMSRGRR